jgi:hypothetical protein
MAVGDAGVPTSSPAIEALATLKALAAHHRAFAEAEQARGEHNGAI